MNNYEYYFLLSKQMKKINYVGLIKKEKENWIMWSLKFKNIRAIWLTAQIFCFLSLKTVEAAWKDFFTTGSQKINHNADDPKIEDRRKAAVMNPQS